MSENRELFNKMLRNNETPFHQPKRDDPFREVRVYKREYLEAGIQYALNHFDEIANFEYEYNFGQPFQTTIAHLKLAKTFIETNRSYPDLVDNSGIIKSIIYASPLSDFFISCKSHLIANQSSDKFSFAISENRSRLVDTIFGEDCERHSVLKDDYQDLFDYKMCYYFSSNTQIIFDSADLSSALDALIMNLSDVTSSKHRIGFLFVQESLKDELFEMLCEDRLNAANQITAEFCEYYDKIDEKLMKRFGGKMLSNKNGTIKFLFNIPPKVSKEHRFDNPFPVIVNFFRTAKEAVQLVKEISAEGISVWTENIGLFYEMAAQLKASIIWSNSIGLIDKMICNAFYGAKDEDRTR